MGEIAKVIKGSHSPLAWLLSGRGPVNPGLAHERAKCCVKCPKNGEGPLTNWFTEPAAEFIRKAIETRADYKLETIFDHGLGTCTACFCPLKTKVHEPLDIALSHLPDSVRKELWPKCWMLSEQQALQNNGGQVK